MFSVWTTGGKNELLCLEDELKCAAVRNGLHHVKDGLIRVENGL